MKVRINLSALTRVEYSEVIEVPDNITDGELDDLLDRRYDDVDGTEFSDDPDFWEKGDSCYWEKEDDGVSVDGYFCSCGEEIGMSEGPLCEDCTEEQRRDEKRGLYPQYEDVAN